MFCKNCKYEVTSDDKFCKECGNPVNKIDELKIEKEVSTPTSISNAEDKVDKTKGESENKLGIILTTIVLVIVVGALIGSVKNGPSYTDSSQTATTSATTTDESQTSVGNNINTLTSSQTNQSVSTAKDLSSIVKEWRGDTAYVVCFWNYSDGTQYKAQSGSALSATLNSAPTIITNKHVVFDPISGYYANECDIRFPDDNGYYYYSKNTPNSRDVGNLTIDSNGNDVAFITGISSSWTSLSGNYSQPADIPFSDHTKDNSYACKSKLSSGDPVLILGYPSYGTQMGSVLNSPAEPTATEGIISGKDGGFYTTSAKIEHGNSGGLAIDKNNDCYFGIPTWNESGSFESLGRILPTSAFLFY